MPETKRPLKVFPSTSASASSARRLRASLCHARADRNAVRALYISQTKDGVDA
jgi:hypothetical protein